MLAISHLANDTMYKAKCAAINQRGRGAFSKTLSASTAAANPPGPVTDFQVSEITGGCVRLTWKEPIDAGGLDIVVYKVFASNLELDITYTMNVNGSTLNVSIGNLHARITYEFTISAVNSVEMVGIPSTISGVTSYPTSPQQPPAPTLIRATGGALHFSVAAPVDCGGWPLVSFTVYVARLSGWDVEYHEFLTRAIESKPDQMTRFIGNVSMYNLLSDSVYFVKVSIQSQYVSVFFYRSHSNYPKQRLTCCCDPVFMFL
jgi:hypothetical protein